MVWLSGWGKAAGGAAGGGGGDTWVGSVPSFDLGRSHPNTPELGFTPPSFRTSSPDLA
jgi:hypothetical protein